NILLTQKICLKQIQIKKLFLCKEKVSTKEKVINYTSIMCYIKLFPYRLDNSFLVGLACKNLI
ncbi:hypothetical protein BM533_23170, partial [Clostridioides difficile]